MRSEKEIREKELTDFLEAGDRTTELTPVSKAFDWVLEGKPRYSWEEWVKKVKQGLEKKQSWASLVFREFSSAPRYSVAELEKIVREGTWNKEKNPDGFAYELDDFLMFLKDRKKVEKILRRD